LNKLVNNR